MITISYFHFATACALATAIGIIAGALLAAFVIDRVDKLIEDSDDELDD